MRLIDKIFRAKFDYELPVSTVRTELEYVGDFRVWLLSGGFEVLHLFVNGLCDLCYETARLLTDEESPEYDDCYDIFSRIHFPKFETDLYPPDGYRSIFIEVTSPFLNPALSRPGDYTVRGMKIFMARVEHNPSHGEGSYSQNQYPRLRKSVLNEEWGVNVSHIFVNERATPQFTYSIYASALSLQNEYSTNYKGLMAFLGLNVVTGGQRFCPVDGHLITDLADVRKLLTQTNGSIVLEPVYSEEWLQNREVWCPFIDVECRSGWLSKRKERLYLPGS